MSQSDRSEPQLLLTGATGVVGRALLPLLPARAVCTLTHRTSLDERFNVPSIAGDIRLPSFGMPERDFHEICEKTDRVVHCAAVIDAIAGPDRVFDSNVIGTERVLEFCEKADADLVYVGTAASHPDLDRDVPVERFSALPYLRSKIEAESRVKASGLPAAVVKASLVIGDEASGEISRFQGLYVMAKLVLQGEVDVVPLLPRSGIDFLPRDVVASALARLALAPGEADGEWWLTAGHHAIQAVRLIEILGTFADELGVEHEAPRFVAPEVVERLVRPAILPELPRRARSRWEYMIELSKPFSAGSVYPSTLQELLAPDETPDTDRLEAAWLASVRYWAQRHHHPTPRAMS